jgi:hypothetical protein
LLLFATTAIFSGISALAVESVESFKGVKACELFDMGKVHTDDKYGNVFLLLVNQAQIGTSTSRSCAQLLSIYDVAHGIANPRPVDLDFACEYNPEISRPR